MILNLQARSAAPAVLVLHWRSGLSHFQRRTRGNSEQQPNVPVGGRALPFRNGLLQSDFDGFVAGRDGERFAGADGHAEIGQALLAPGEFLGADVAVVPAFFAFGLGVVNDPVLVAVW